MNRPAGEVVLTTGANSGIGLATVVELARAGYDSVGSVRSAAKAKIVHDAGAGAGVELRTVILDVTDAGACERVLNRLQPWGLVNNAGVPATGAVEDVDDAEAHAVAETMIHAPMRLARLAIPHMRAAGGGRIINLSSIYGRTSTPLTGWYQGCKHALEALTDALRMEVASSGIKVVLIEPGGFKTGIWSGSSEAVGRRQGSHYQEAYRRSEMSTRMAERFMGDPRSVAKTILSALRSPRPRPRYLVGNDAKAIALWDSLLPTEAKDMMYRLSLGL